MNIFETLNKLSDNQRKHSKDNGFKSNSLTVTIKESKDNSKRKDPSYIYLDENNQVKEKKLSKLDSAGSALINKAMKKKQNPAKLIRDSIFGKL